MDLAGDSFLTASALIEYAASHRSTTNLNRRGSATSHRQNARIIRASNNRYIKTGLVKASKSRAQTLKRNQNHTGRRNQNRLTSIPIQKRSNRSTVSKPATTQANKRSYNRRVTTPAVLPIVQTNGAPEPLNAIPQAPKECRSETVSSKRRTYVRAQNRPTGAKRSLSRFARKKDEPADVKSTTSSSDLSDLHEAFVKNFAIPTHLYRYLAQRHRQRPLYLDRTLSYLRPSVQPAEKQLHSTSRTKPPRSIHTVAERLYQAQQQKLKSHCGRFGKKNEIASPSTQLIRDIRSSPPTDWPHEVQLSFEGFFDSEKETDWVTVEASVGLCFRFGASWRHKPSPGDTVMTPFHVPVPLACFNPISGLEHHPATVNPTAGSDCYQFRPLELLQQAKWLTSGGRLNSGQLELRISAVERRWLKRPELSRPNSLTSQNGSGSIHRSGPAATRKGGLSSASYPVHYSTAPLPLFYPAYIASTLSESHPFLLTPGLYELRLGVDRDEHNTADPVPVVCVDKRSKSTVCNGYHNETGVTTDSVANDLPNGTMGLIDGQGSMNDFGVASGRVEWRRIRFPNSSDAVDEYSRWPRLRFRVTWRHRGTLDPGVSSTQKAETKKLEHSMNGTPETNRLSLRSATPVSPPRSTSLLARCLTDPLKPLPSSPSNHVVQTVGLSHERSPVHLSDPSTVSKTAYPRNSLLPTRCPSNSTCNVSPVRPVTYRFVYRGQLQQWSESRDLICPWCRLDCGRAREKGPEALLVHLRTCHPRFRFKASWSPSRSHLMSLEISLNEAYDGSNDCGLRRWSSCTVSRGRSMIPPGQVIGGWTGLGIDDAREDHMSSSQLAGSSLSSRVPCPVRRLPYTHLIFWRGADRANDQPSDPTLSVRPLAVGHNRVYYHTRSVQPIRACEFDVDSEAEDAPGWLRQHYQRKVEEFTDVNQGEKQIMQLWNTLLLSISPSELVVCDAQVANLASCFVHRYASAIHRRRLRNNLLLHFANLVDYGLLSAGQMRHLVTAYDKLALAGRVQNTG